MPTKYADRLNIPEKGSDLTLMTKNGLVIANGYKKVVYSKKKPYLEIQEDQLNKSSIEIPDAQNWRLSQSSAPYIEYRSKDCWNIKIIRQKSSDHPEFKAGLFYISAFDLKSDKIKFLMEPLRKRVTSS